MHHLPYRSAPFCTESRVFHAYHKSNAVPPRTIETPARGGANGVSAAPRLLCLRHPQLDAADRERRRVRISSGRRPHPPLPSRRATCCRVSRGPSAVACSSNYIDTPRRGRSVDLLRKILAYEADRMMDKEVEGLTSLRAMSARPPGPAIAAAITSAPGKHASARSGVGSI